MGNQQALKSVQTQLAAPPLAPAIPFDLVGRCIAIAREKTGDRKYLVVELFLEEDGGALKMARHSVLDQSYHRIGAEEQAMLEVGKRTEGTPVPAHRCEWPVGWEHVDGPVPCNRSAIAKNANELTPKNFSAGFPPGAARRTYKLCEDHAELMRVSFKQPTVVL